MVTPDTCGDRTTDGRRTLSETFAAVARPVLAVLVLTLCLLQAGVSAAWAARVALVIGNGAYEHVSALPNPRNDAVAISDKLTGMGFEVDRVIDADLATLRARVEAFGERATGAETAIIFYAGHGMQLQGSNYLLPTDARIRSREDLAGAALRVTDLYEQFNRAAPETAILILDACRDNPFASSVATAQGLTSGSVSPRGFVQRPNAAGMLIAFAAAPGAVASDGADGNSPYTTALLQWMDRPGLELATMFRRVRGTVLDLTNGTQVPWVEEALVRDIYLNPDPAPAGPAESDRIEVALLENIRTFESDSEKRAGQTFYDRYLVNAAAGDVPPEDDPFVQEGLIWLSIRQSTDADVFQAFAEQFPDSPFTTLARQRLRDLAASPPPQVIAWLDDLDPVPPPPGGSEAVYKLAIGSEDDTRSEAPGPLAQAQPDQTLPQTGDAPPPSPARLEQDLGLTTDELAAVQLLLRQAGVYSGPPDADYGPGTRNGIERLQQDIGLPVTGYLDVLTLRQIVTRAAGAVLRSEIPEARAAQIHRIAAVAARGPGSEPQVLKVAAINRNDTVHEYWRQIADDFQAERPGTLVEFDFRPGVRYRAELMSILGAETPPDILYTWGGGHLEALRRAGFARDLTDEMVDGWALEFKPGALQNYTHDGRIHGVPMHLALVSLYVNKAVMRRAGIDPTELSTWEGFLGVVERLKAQGITPLAVGGGDRWPFHLYFASLAQRLGGRAAFEAALAGEGAGFLTPPFLRAGEEFARLAALEPFQPGYLEMDDGQAVETFAAGEAAMILTGNWRLQKMRWSWPGGPEARDADLLHLEFPAIGDLPQATLTHGGADGFAVNTSAPDIAVDFLRRLTAIDVQERMVEIASDVPSMSGADLGVGGSFLGEAASELLSSTYHQLYLDQALGPDAGDVLTESMVLVASGRMTGTQAVEAVDTAWNRVLAGTAAPIAAE